MSLRNKDRQFAVMGLGRFGKSVAITLADNGCSVLACDANEELVCDVAEYVTHAVQVDASDEAAIESLGLGNFDAVIIAVGHDLEASLIATMVAKEAGAPYVVVKANDQRQRKILEGVGADKVIFPEKEMGEKVAMKLITTNLVDYMSLSGEYDLREMRPLSEWVGKTLEQAKVRAAYGLNVIAIKRDGEAMIMPHASDVISASDVLVVIGKTHRRNA